MRRVRRQDSCFSNEEQADGGGNFQVSLSLFGSAAHSQVEMGENPSKHQSQSQTSPPIRQRLSV